MTACQMPRSLPHFSDQAERSIDQAGSLTMMLQRIAKRPRLSHIVDLGTYGDGDFNGKMGDSEDPSRGGRLRRAPRSGDIRRLCSVPPLGLLPASEISLHQQLSDSVWLTVGIYRPMPFANPKPAYAARLFDQKSVWAPRHDEILQIRLADTQERASPIGGVLSWWGRPRSVSRPDR